MSDQASAERRQYGRVRPIQRLRGMLGTVPIVVIDISMNGVRVAHQEPLKERGTASILKFEWDGRTLTMQCEVRRSRLEREARNAFDKPLYHSGLSIVSLMASSRDNLRDLIAACVSRALDEQKANAKGIPAVAAQSFQTGRAGDEFLRCEFRDGTWRKVKTQLPDQPNNGFTVSVNEEPEKVDMLCRAYESGDADARKLLRTFASLSISKTEGIPTRRYSP